jgi:4-diphosphocytidyl-2-C-methyl-D-erythritol kinase
MGGIGEVLSPHLGLAPLPAVLVNPGAASPTPAVFAGMGFSRGQCSGQAAFVEPLDGDVVAALAKGCNDMQASAERLTPAITETLAALREAGAARLVRMSGSGATCFALYANRHAAARAAARLRRMRPHWWVRGTFLR